MLILLAENHIILYVATIGKQNTLCVRIVVWPRKTAVRLIRLVLIWSCDLNFIGNISELMSIASLQAD